MLYIACSRGQTEMVQILLFGIANPDLANQETGNTAMMIAAQNGHLDIIKLLIYHNCDIFALNKNGMNVLSFASKHRQHIIIKYIYHHLVETMNINKNKDKLLKFSKQKISSFVNQANINCDTGDTPYILACKSGHEPTIRVLVSICHANVNKCNKNYKHGSDFIDGTDNQNLKNWLIQQEARK